MMTAVKTIREPWMTRDSVVDSPRPRLVHGWRRWLYIGMGLFFVGLAGLGVVLPGLPTTPFLLLASFFFVRSSPAWEAWLLRSPVFGPLLRDWKEHRGVRPMVKWGTVLVIVAVVGATLLVGELPTWLRGIVAGLALVGLTVVLRLPVIREQPGLGDRKSA